MFRNCLTIHRNIRLLNSENFLISATIKLHLLLTHLFTLWQLIVYNCVSAAWHLQCLIDKDRSSLIDKDQLVTTHTHGMFDYARWSLSSNVNRAKSFSLFKQYLHRDVVMSRIISTLYASYWNEVQILVVQNEEPPIDKCSK